jgi:signal transduction histidine kinase
MVLSPFGGLNTEPHAFEALAEYLQKEIEERCRLLARELHDDLGGSLIAAMMDVAWLTRQTSTGGGEVSVRLHRIDDSLTRAIESTRRLVDELQPALIDSVGLFVAMSAHFGRQCCRYEIRYTDALVGVAPDIDAASAMSVFRIAQGFLQWIREDAGAKELHARYEGDSERLTMRFIMHGIPAGTLPNQGVAAPRLTAIALRLRKLNGTMRSEASNGSLTIQVQIPTHASHPQIAA